MQSTPPRGNRVIYRQGSRTQTHVSSNICDGSSCVTQQHDMMVEVSQPPNYNTQLSSPQDASMDSVNSLSSLSSEYCQLILPYVLLRMVCDKLDSDHPLGHDWKMLASHFYLDDCIDRLERGVKCNKSPTWELIKVLQCKLLLKSYRDLIEVLEKIERSDVAMMIEQEIVKYDMQQYEKPCLPSYTPRALEGNQNLALEYPEEKTSPAITHANDADQRVATGLPQIPSPPLATTPGQSPDTPGSDRARVPEDLPTTPLTSQGGKQHPRHLKGESEINEHDQSHVKHSLGPNNVHPEEDNNARNDKLQEDGVTVDRSHQNNVNRNNIGRLGMDSNKNEVQTHSEVNQYNNLSPRLDNDPVKAT